MVAQVFHLLYRRFSTCWTSFAVGWLADCKSAIRHIVNLRYDSWAAILGLIVFCGELSAQTSTSAREDTRFVAVDIFVDSQDKPLAAYQLEFSVTNSAAKIVGIEGGEHAAFGKPPFYDPKAMQRERVIIAAFSTEPADKLPVGKTRVATIHLLVSGRGELKLQTYLQTAANSDGSKTAAETSATEKKAK